VPEEKRGTIDSAIHACNSLVKSKSPRWIKTLREDGAESGRLSQLSEAEREVFRQFRQAQDKYVYFLLAAAGAAIGLAVNQTQTATIRWSELPLAFAVICWALSFVCGCCHLGYQTSSLYANMALLRVESGRHPEIGEHPQMMSAASQGIRDAIASNSNRATRYGKSQFAFLVSGAVFYLAWHVAEMWLRTVKTG
jgi:hypothetical protein